MLAPPAPSISHCGVPWCILCHWWVVTSPEVQQKFVEGKDQAKVRLSSSMKLHRRQSVNRVAAVFVLAVAKQPLSVSHLWHSSSAQGVEMSMQAPPAGCSACSLLMLEVKPSLERKGLKFPKPCPLFFFFFLYNFIFSIYYVSLSRKKLGKKLGKGMKTKWRFLFWFTGVIRGNPIIIHSKNSECFCALLLLYLGKSSLDMHGGSSNSLSQLRRWR